MGEIAGIVGGGTPKTANPANFQHGDIPWITPADLSGYKGKFIGRGARSITERGFERSSARLLPSGSVLFSSRAPIGYVAIASQPVTTNQGFKSFVLPDGIDSSYIYYYLLRSKELIEGLGGGTTFKEISGARAATIPLALAPLPEQHRIVAEIEKQLTRLDASVAALERVRANLKRYRASVLKTACEGRLVPTEAQLARAENRGYEPAGRLLERILAERAAASTPSPLTGEGRGEGAPKPKRRRKYKEPAPPDTSTLPKLPEGWVWATVEQVGAVGEQSVLTGPFGTNLKRTDFTSTGIPVLTIGCLNEAGILLDKAAYVSNEKAHELSRYALRAGDLLFSRMATVGRAGLVGPDIAGCVFNYHIMRLRLDEGTVSPKFFMSYVRGSSDVDRYVRNINHGSTRDGINTVQLLAMPIAVAPLAEQHRIVADVERRLSVVQQAEAAVEAGLKRAGRLRQSILKRAFSGKLVPQDPADEPASTLLERIRAERAAASTPSPLKGEGRGEGLPQRKPRRRKSKPAPARQLSF